MDVTPLILIADDSIDDRIILARLFRTEKIPATVKLFEDGAEVIDFLSALVLARAEDLCGLPVLLLADIKMPRADGFDVLRWVRAHPMFAEMPVVMLSSSSLPADRQRAARLGANDYLVKQPDLTSTRAMVAELGRCYVPHLPLAQWMAAGGGENAGVRIRL